MPSIHSRDGLRISWRETGTGPSLLCHPGGPGASGRYFDGLPELARERTLLLLDPRGTGASDRPSDPAAYELSDYASDIEAIRGHLGLERLEVLGHSHGGFVAMAWASAYPERVERLVLASTAPRFTEEIRRARQAIVASCANEPWYGEAVAAIEAHQAGRYADDAELAELLEREAPFYFPRWDAEAQTLAGRLRDAGFNSDALRHFNDRIAPRMDLRDGLAHVSAPSLVIAGELDPLGEPSAREIAGPLPDARVVVLPGASHFPFAESASREAWARAILAFLVGASTANQGETE